MSLSNLLYQAARAHAGRTALRHGERAWTYAELDRLTEQLAAGFLARGLRPGDRVAFLLPNSPELAFVNLACLKLGAVAVPLNPRLKGSELAYILCHSQSRICIAAAELFPELAAERGQLPEVEAYFIVGLPRPAGTEDFAALPVPSPTALPPVAIDGQAPAAILYTSGSTARPKGAAHGQAGLAAAVRNYAEAVGLGEKDVVLGMLSMSHVFGYTLQLLAPLGVGGTVVIASDFAPGKVLDLIARHRVSHLYGLPAMFDALSRHPAAARADTRSLRYCLAGGDAVPPVLGERTRSVLGVELYEGCGMTEVLPYTLNRPAFPNRPGSIGRPSVGMELRLVDEAGRDVPAGEAGEILVRSEALMLGYWNDPETTASLMRDGWFRTGDVGRRDGDGYYWFVGRRKEIIKRAGSKISPLEVEDALCRHPAVREVAVVGKPDADLGERVAAFVVLRPEASADAAGLQAFALERIAAYKVPEVYHFVAALPRGTTGKVHRKTLRAWATDPAVAAVRRLLN
jgi:long-chain acyl-CoA synthetase